MVVLEAWTHNLYTEGAATYTLNPLRTKGIYGIENEVGYILTRFGDILDANQAFCLELISPRLLGVE